jgi:hypothetical protein
LSAGSGLGPQVGDPTLELGGAGGRPLAFAACGEPVGDGGVVPFRFGGELAV